MTSTIENHKWHIEWKTKWKLWLYRVYRVSGFPKIGGVTFLDPWKKDYNSWGVYIALPVFVQTTMHLNCGTPYPTR